jgi:hypothetical protein
LPALARARAVPICGVARRPCEKRSHRRRVGVLPTKGSRADLALDRNHRDCPVGHPWLLWPGTFLSLAAPARSRGDTRATARISRRRCAGRTFDRRSRLRQRTEPPTARR